MSSYQLSEAELSILSRGLALFRTHSFQNDAWLRIHSQTEAQVHLLKHTEQAKYIQTEIKTKPRQNKLLRT